MRRRFVWIQGAAPLGGNFFFLYEGDDGYYVMDAAGNSQFVAPYVDAQNPGGITRSGFTAIGTNDWRFAAAGATDIISVNLLFYGPSGLVSSATNTLTTVGGAVSVSGLIQEATVQGTGVRQRYWYTHTGDAGIGDNTSPDTPPNFILPGVTVPTGSTGFYWINDTLTWAVCQNKLVSIDGTIINITIGAPDPWPDNVSFSGGFASLVGLTLYVYNLPSGGNVSITPYTYDPDAGTATQGDTFALPVASLPSGALLRFMSYWKG